MTALPAHLFTVDTGELYDTRDPNWSSSPLRPNYRRHHRTISSVADLKATLRAGPSTDLGDDHWGWRISSLQVNYEDTDLRCEHTDDIIPSACGES